MARHQVGTNLVWEAQIQQIALGEAGVGPDLTPEEETQVPEVLFDLLDKFLADQERARQNPHPLIGMRASSRPTRGLGRSDRTVSGDIKPAYVTTTVLRHREVGATAAHPPLPTKSTK